MTRDEYITDALDFLDSINDASWEVVMGSQDRQQFAALAFDADQAIEDAWIAAVRAINTF